jgi:hypothetical protein
MQRLGAAAAGCSSGVMTLLWMRQSSLGSKRATQQCVRTGYLLTYRGAISMGSDIPPSRPLSWHRTATCVIVIKPHPCSKHTQARLCMSCVAAAHV